MSNYYKSKCCGKELTGGWNCTGCGRICAKESEVTAMIDEPNGVPTHEMLKSLKNNAMLEEAIASVELANGVPREELKKEWEREFVKDFCITISYRDTELIYFKGFNENNFNLIPTPKDIMMWFDEIVESLLAKQQEEFVKIAQKEEAHGTMHGWCCACDYDQIELNRRLEVQKAEIISLIMGMMNNNEILLLDGAKIINKIRETIR